MSSFVSKVDRQEWCFVALDGDDVGRELERLIAWGDVQMVIEFSSLVSRRLDELGHLTASAGGTILFCSGDSLLAHIPIESATELCKEAATGSPTLSGGIGPGMLQAMLALKLAKARGRGRYEEWARVSTAPTSEK